MSKKKPILVVRKACMKLVNILGKIGICAKVSAERIPETRLHRIRVIAKAFDNMPNSDSQDLIRRIIDRVVSREDSLLVLTVKTTGS